MLCMTICFTHKCGIALAGIVCSSPVMMLDMLQLGWWWVLSTAILHAAMLTTRCCAELVVMLLHVNAWHLLEVC